MLARMALYSSTMEFMIDTETLVEYELNDICQVCCRYRKHILFYVRHPTDKITISLRIGTKALRKLSGFPQNMRWFETQQGLRCPFGMIANGYQGRLSCSAFEKSHKRKFLDIADFQPLKRVKK